MLRSEKKILRDRVIKTVRVILLIAAIIGLWVWSQWDTLTLPERRLACLEDAYTTLDRTGVSLWRECYKQHERR